MTGALRKAWRFLNAPCRLSEFAFLISVAMLLGVTSSFLLAWTLGLTP